MQIVRKDELQDGHVYWHVFAVEKSKLIFDIKSDTYKQGAIYDGNIVYDNQEEAEEMKNALNLLLSPHVVK